MDSFIAFVHFCEWTFFFLIRLPWKIFFITVAVAGVILEPALGPSAPRFLLFGSFALRPRARDGESLTAGSAARTEAHALTDTRTHGHTDRDFLTTEGTGCPLHRCEGPGRR